MEGLKYCKHCANQIPADAIVCTQCGRQVEQLRNGERAGGRKCSKWVAFFLCLFLGYFGGHKFYEGKIGTGILYMFTGGLFVIGAFIDLFNILGKHNPYYV